jgi:hypothetical protein
MLQKVEVDSFLIPTLFYIAEEFIANLCPLERS